MTIQRLLILGAGYSALELVRLMADSHPHFAVTATTRNPDSADILRAHGATPIEWSVGDDLSALTDAMGPDVAILYSIPTLFSDYQPAHQGIARHVQPVHQVFQAARRQQVPRFIYLSSTSAYGDHQGQWVDEHSPLLPQSPFGQMRRDIEAYLLRRRQQVPVTVARLVGIYGPERSLIGRLQSDRFRLVDGGKKISNRVHVHDIARALTALITAQEPPKSLYNITDGHPQTLRDLVAFICSSIDLPLPPEESLDDYASRTQNPNAVARWKTRIRVLNERLRRDFDFTFTYPDAFAGYSSILNADTIEASESSS